jgi:hypothetical protein
VPLHYLPFVDKLPGPAAGERPDGLEETMLTHTCSLSSASLSRDDVFPAEANRAPQRETA